MKEKVLSILLAMVMVISLLPATAMAETTPDTVFKISASGKADQSLTAWNADALNYVIDYRKQAGAVTVTMQKDYNTTENASLNFGGEVFTLDLNGHTLGGGCDECGECDGGR